MDKLHGRIERIFAEVLLVCHEEGLLSGTHLSLDGLKLPGNASREWSGTFTELRSKADKLQRKLKEKVAEHRRQDRLDKKRPERAEKASAQERTVRLASIKRLTQKAERMAGFLEAEEPKEGARGNEVQSNVTDNDSAKMLTSHGTIQGYNAQALVDDKNQIIVHAAPSGVGQDHRQIGPMLNGAQTMLELSGLNEKLTLEGIQLTADCNYHSEANLRACEEHQIDAVIPDNHFRSRDVRYASQERHKARFRGNKTSDRFANKKEHFDLSRFTHQPENDTYLCPAGKELTCQSASHGTGDGHHYRRYRSKARDCAGCQLRSQCIARNGRRKSLAISVDTVPATLTARMRQKVDTPEARKLYGRRLAIIEPVFGNIRANKGLNRFTYRGLGKVSVQWSLYCLVHNIEKLAHYGRKYGKNGVASAVLAVVSVIAASQIALQRFLVALDSFFDHLPSLTNHQPKLHFA